MNGSDRSNGLSLLRNLIFYMEGFKWTCITKSKVEPSPPFLITGGADVRNWTFLTPLLAKHYKVVAYDGRGTGKSPSPLEDVNHVEDLLSLLDHLEIKQATLLVIPWGARLLLNSL